MKQVIALAIVVAVTVLSYCAQACPTLDQAPESCPESITLRTMFSFEPFTAMTWERSRCFCA